MIATHGSFLVVLALVGWPGDGPQAATKPAMGIHGRDSGVGDGLPRGYLITDVTGGSAADKSGLRRGDVLTGLGSKPVLGSESIAAWLESAKDGEKTNLHVRRRNRRGQWEKRALGFTMEFGPDNSRTVARATDAGLRSVPQESTVYLPRGGRVTRWSFCAVTYDGENSTEGFFQVKGSAEKLAVESSNPGVLSIRNHGEGGARGAFVARLGEEYEFKSPGETTIKATVGASTVESKIKVVELPVTLGSASAAVIKTLGLPDEKETVYVSWPDVVIVDFIAYRPPAGTPVAAEHWRYKAYPGAALSIIGGKLHEVGTSTRRRSGR